MKNEWKYALSGALLGPVIAYGAAALKSNIGPEVESIKYPAKKHLACVGDSITYGFGVMLNRKAESFPSLLQEALGDEWEVLNYGYSARTVQESGDFPYSKSRIYRKSLEAKADIYTIMLGTNDTKSWNWDPEQFEKEYRALVEQYIALAGKENVILMKPIHSFPVLGFNTYGIRDAEITLVCDVVERTAKEFQCPLLDLNTLSEGHKEWLPDGVHPNKAANRILADAILPMIKTTPHY